MGKNIDQDYSQLQRNFDFEILPTQQSNERRTSVLYVVYQLMKIEFRISAAIFSMPSDPVIWFLRSNRSENS